MKQQRKNQAVWLENQKRWMIRIQIDGNRKAFYSSTPGIRGKIEAEHKADDWIEFGTTGGCRNFRDLYNQYLQDLQNRQTRTGRGSAQYTKMESIGRVWVLPLIGHKKIDRITCGDYQKCIDAAFDAGRSQKTLLHILSLFSNMYTYSRKNKIKIEKPEYIEIYQEAPTYQRDAMPVNSVRTLFKIDNFRDHDKIVACPYIHAFRLACLLGLRRGELAGLKWTDINDRILHVQRSINNLGEQTAGKTKAANRSIYLFDLAMNEIDQQRDDLKKRGILSPWIFPNIYNGGPSYLLLYKHWTMYCKTHDIHNNLHELRHTTVSLAMGQINLDSLKPVIGHTKSMDTFGIYGHETEENLKAVGDGFQKIFSGIIGS